MYVYGLPTCSNCALGVIQVGVKKVVMPEQDIPERWQDSWSLTKSMFEEAGVDYSFINYEKDRDSWIESR
jgi:dCMP deaminase